MTAFDLPEVRGFAEDLDARMNRCENGEGTECATLDDALQLYAKLCREFVAQVRQWGQAIFYSRVAFDPEVERVFLNEGMRLFSHANAAFERGGKAEEECWMLDGRTALAAALWDMHRVLDGWITPTPAVGPSVRHGLASHPTVLAEARRRIEALSPLPSAWSPPNPHPARSIQNRP
jgi:hypothetical protein